MVACAFINKQLIYKQWVFHQLFLSTTVCLCCYICIFGNFCFVDSQLTMTCCTCRSHVFDRNTWPGPMIRCDCMELYVCYPCIHTGIIIHLWHLFMGNKMIQMERLLPQQTGPPPAPFWCPWAACSSMSHSICNSVTVFELSGSFSLTLMVNRKVFARICGNGELGRVNVRLPLKPLGAWKCWKLLGKKSLVEQSHLMPGYKLDVDAHCWWSGPFWTTVCACRLSHDCCDCVSVSWTPWCFWLQAALNMSLFS